MEINLYERHTEKLTVAYSSEIYKEWNVNYFSFSKVFFLLLFVCLLIFHEVHILR